MTDLDLTSPLYDRVDEMVTCVIDCSLEGSDLREYIDEWMSNRGDGKPESPRQVIEELWCQFDALSPLSREHFRETYEAIESAIRTLEPSGGDR